MCKSGSVASAILRPGAALLVTVLLYACATYSGIQEFQAYRTAFDSVHSTSMAILDQLAIQERVIGRRIYRVGAGLKFNPDLAPYYTDAVDPPGTAAFRGALDTVKTYNDLLYGLASGETAEALVAKIGELNVSVGKAADAVASLAPTGTDAAAGAVVLKSGLESAFTRLRPVLKIALGFRSRQEFRRYLVENHELVRSLLVEVRNGTSVIFPILTGELLRRRDTGEKIAAYQRLLADWVILIDATIRALDAARLAIEASPTIGSSISSLGFIAADLQATADVASKHLAEVSVR